MKKIFSLTALLIPNLIFACSCAWITSFCETIDKNSTVANVRITEKFQDSESRHFIKVAFIENIRGTVQSQEMSILASSNSSCDPSHELFEIGDTMIVHITEPANWTNEPHDFYFENGCSEPFLFVKNGQINPKKIAATARETYSEFKNNIDDCAALSVLNDPGIINQLLQMFPNPVSETLNLRIPSAPQISYTVFDASGKKITERTESADRIEVNTLGLAKGVYFIKIKVAEAFLTKRFVKV